MGIEAVKMNDTSAYQGSTHVQTYEKNTSGNARAAENLETGVRDKKEDVSLDAAEDNGGQGNNNSQLKSAVNDLNKKMKNSEAIFGIHEKTNRVMIKIVDKDTKEVIKEYPPEATLDMIAKVWEVAGLMVDEKR